MKDGMEYAEMLEMPVSSCDVVFKPAKRKKRKNVKEEVIAKVNASETEEGALAQENTEVKFVQKGLFGLKKIFAKKPTSEIYGEKASGEEQKSDSGEEITESAVIKAVKGENGGKKAAKSRKKFKFDIIYAEGVAIFVLVAAILLTNIFWENSGINTVFKNTFGTGGETALDTRTYLSFSAKSPSEELSAAMDGGVLTLSGTGAVYPVCDGKVSSVTEENGKYTITISHSDVFKTVVSGVDYAYAEKGDEVFKYIPVGYVGGGDATVKMYDGENLLTSYILENGTIVWES
ncbi:MAG: hypothetical protein J6N93_06470 [Clostridia bacterium]|nr:hypothetical protein [Clostridia bacterium]